MKLLLFDIDGTLMLSGGAGSAALNRAIEDVTGVANAMEGVPCAGRVDPLIIQDALRNAGIRLPHELKWIHQKVSHRYFELLPGVIREINKARALDGVVETLEWLQQQTNTTLAVGTGNARVSAEIKLSSVGLWGYFPFGGFGDDGADRIQMLQAAYHRALEFGMDVRLDDVLVIGDTVHDITAAQKAGMQVAAISTGSNTYDSLLAHQPDHCWKTMLEGLQWFQESGFLYESFMI